MSAEYKKQHRLKNAEKYKAYQKKYRDANREKLREANALYYNSPHIKERYILKRATPSWRRGNTIRSWKHLGIKCDEEWDEVFEWYKDATHCWICDKTFNELYTPRNGATRCLDHDHTTDEYNVRGVICVSCNVNN